MTPGRAVLLALVAQGCATSSASNYSIKYALSGPATETASLNQAAESVFKAEPTEGQKLEHAQVKVFIDSVPAELTLRDNVVGIAPRSTAQLVGSVELSAVWKTPDEAAVLPAIQKAASAVGANLAFCPRASKAAAHVWQCTLVRTAEPPQASPPARL